MADLNSIIARARRRLVVDKSLRSGALGLIGSLTVGLLVLVLDRVMLWDTPEWAFGVVALTGALIGIIVALMQSPGAPEVAILLDRRLNLKDRIATAEALSRVRSSGGLQSELAPLVEAEAQRLAAHIDVRSAAPVRFSNSWLLALALAALLVAGVLSLPPLRDAGHSRPGWLTAGQREQVEQEARSVAADITSAVGPIDRDSVDEQSMEQLRALDRLAQQLTAPVDDPQRIGQMRQESAARMSELADRLERDSLRDDAAADRLLERFAGMEIPQAPMTADQFAEALRRGDFGRAADSLDSLLDSRGTMSETERQQLADEMSQLGDMVRDAGQTPHDPATDERIEQLHQALRDHGVDEQTIDRLVDPANSTEHSSGQSPQDALEQHDIDPALAERMADELQKLHEQRDVQDRAGRDAEKLAEALRDAAEQLRQDPPADAPDPPSADQQHPDQQQQQRSDEPGQDQRPREESSAQDRAEGQQANESERDADRRQQQHDAPPDQPSQSTRKPRGEQQPSPPDGSGQSQETGELQQHQSPNPESTRRGGEKPQGNQPSRDPSTENGADQGKAERGGEPQSLPKTQSKTQPKPGDQPGAAPMPQSGSAPAAKPARDAPGNSAAERPDPARPLPSESGAQQAPADQQSPGDQRSFDATRQPGQTDNSSDTAQEPTDQPDAMDNQPSSPADQIRDVAGRRDAASKRRQISERLREAAERMSSGRRADSTDQTDQPGAGDEMQNRPPRWPPARGVADGEDAGAGPADGRPDLAEAAPFVADDSDDVNLAGEETGDQVIAQWLGDEQSEPGTSSATATDGGRIAAAQRAAQRALEQSAVPPRYRGPIQRYFGRLPDTLKRASSPPPPPSTPPPAPDAGQVSP